SAREIGDDLSAAVAGRDHAAVFATDKLAANIELISLLDLQSCFRFAHGRTIAQRAGKGKAKKRQLEQRSAFVLRRFSNIQQISLRLRGASGVEGAELYHAGGGRVLPQRRPGIG